VSEPSVNSSKTGSNSVRASSGRPWPAHSAARSVAVRSSHFAAWEQPEHFSAEARAAFRPLRKAASHSRWRKTSCLRHRQRGETFWPPQQPRVQSVSYPGNLLRRVTATRFGPSTVPDEQLVDLRRRIAATRWRPGDGQ
jgi:hypothetical protein